MEAQELFEKIKPYIILEQDINSNWLELKKDVPFDLLMVKLSKKEQKIYDNLCKEYLIDNII